MKKFIIFLLFVGAVAGAGYFLYEPYLKEHIDPLLNEGVPHSKDSAAPVASTPSSNSTPQPKTDTPPQPAPVAKKSDAPKAAPKSEIDLLVEKRYPLPEIQPLVEIVDNWNRVPRNAFPKQVTSIEPIPFQIVSSNGQVIGETKVNPGTAVAPLTLNGPTLTVASIANAKMTSQIAVDKTNFKSQIEDRYNAFVTRTEDRVKALRAKAKKALQDRPELMAANTSDAGDSGDPRFAPVKASLSRGEADNVKLEEATAFRYNGTERIGGDKPGSYETVTVNFEVSTIFGRFPTEYKCLLQGGKVVAWIDPITEEIL